jgi:hypothetical protein
MATRVKAAVVGQACMRLKEKWTVYKCVKSVSVPNTALFMMWTEDDAKHHPSTVFQDNVRIASLKGAAAGVYVFTFKDNGGRQGVPAAENVIGGMTTETLVITTPFAIGTTAGDGAVVPGIVLSGELTVVEDGKLTENAASMTTPTPIGSNEMEDLHKGDYFNFTNPPPPPGTVVQDVSSSLPETIRELRAMEALLKDKKKMVRHMKKRALDEDDKRAQKKLLEDQLKAIKKEVQSEKAKAKQEKPRVRRKSVFVWTTTKTMLK